MFVVLTKKKKLSSREMILILDDNNFSLHIYFSDFAFHRNNVYKFDR